DLRVLVETTADAVAAVLAHDRVTVALGVDLDGVAYVAEGGARPHGADPLPHALVAHAAQALGDHRGLADEKHAARVAVEAVLDDRDVDVDDVAVLELALAGNAVTDDVVHGGADRLR